MFLPLADLILVVFIMESSKPQPRDGLKLVLWPINKMPIHRQKVLKNHKAKKLHRDTAGY